MKVFTKNINLQVRLPVAKKADMSRGMPFSEYFNAELSV